MSDKLGSKWLAQCDLLPDEKEVWSRLANRTQGRWRAVGGKLFLTNKRVIFLPYFFDAMLSGDQWLVERSNVAKVDTVQPDGGMFSGGLRERVRVSLKDGSESLFVVTDPRDTAHKMQEAGLPG